MEELGLIHIAFTDEINNAASNTLATFFIDPAEEKLKVKFLDGSVLDFTIADGDPVTIALP